MELDRVTPVSKRLGLLHSRSLLLLYSFPTQTTGSCLRQKHTCCSYRADNKERLSATAQVLSATVGGKGNPRQENFAKTFSSVSNNKPASERIFLLCLLFSFLSIFFPSPQLPIVSKVGATLVMPKPVDLGTDLSCS